MPKPEWAHTQERRWLRVHRESFEGSDFKASHSVNKDKYMALNSALDFSLSSVNPPDCPVELSLRGVSIRNNRWLCFWGKLIIRDLSSGSKTLSLSEKRWETNSLVPVSTTEKEQAVLISDMAARLKYLEIWKESVHVLPLI